jgi:hypothetical protein
MAKSAKPSVKPLNQRTGNELTPAQQKQAAENLRVRQAMSPRPLPPAVAASAAAGAAAAKAPAARPVNPLAPVRTARQVGATLASIGTKKR